MSENIISEQENNVSEKSPTAEETTPPATNDETPAENSQETAATTAVVKIEGQEFPLDVAIAADDNLLKTALSPHYPSIKNAQITRETRAGQMIVSIVKKAEHKGKSGVSDENEK